MKFRETNIKGCFSINPEVIEDNRGGFFRVFCKNEFQNIIGDVSFTQINHSMNSKKGTFRGMHFQQPPYAEGKLIRCIAGKVLDIFLDLRKESPTFLHYEYVELNAKNRNMIYLCKGIAHGFYTLENNSELIYHHTESYQQEADRGICYNDPRINIQLPGKINVISTKDLSYPLLPKEFKGLVL